MVPLLLQAFVLQMSLEASSHCYSYRRHEHRKDEDASIFLFIVSLVTLIYIRDTLTHGRSSSACIVAVDDPTTAMVKSRFQRYLGMEASGL